ncbi:MAG: methyltransferase [Campylobacterota bacterium]|nr:methyltransferase [Campylobacterota bacterium]
MNIAREFSRFASSYDRVNIIQKEVASQLVAQVKPQNYPSILDLGCGSGEVYKNVVSDKIDFDRFIGVDIAPNMLELHPKEARVELRNVGFDNPILKEKRYDLVLSASALQWSQDLKATLANIYALSKQFHFAIFTANTFKSLHKVAGISSPIYSVEYLQEQIDLYFDASYSLNHYKLYFDSTYEMLRYIKSSGVSGGQKKLSYKQIKDLIEHYSLDYLEFEVLFVEAKKRRSTS